MSFDLDRRLEELLDDVRRLARGQGSRRVRDAAAEQAHWSAVAGALREAADELERRFDANVDQVAKKAARSAEAPVASDRAQSPVANANFAAPVGAEPERFAVVGDSAPMRRLLELVDRLAPTDVPVLVRGETGSGKEGIARRLHSKSARSKGPFVAIDCGAIPASLIESELFGHVRGSFTGADRDRPGHFVTANGGTLMLDEIGELPSALQPKLLRVLQDGEVRAVGGSTSRKVDVRVVAATNRDLERACREGRFRQDLYYRLAVVELEVPPLRDRLDDVPLLVAHFVTRIAAEMGREPPVVTPDALAALAEQRWPGNVRELENALRRAMALSAGVLDRAAFAASAS